MRKDLIKTVRDNLVDVVLDSVCYGHRYVITRDQIDSVRRGCGYDVDPRIVIYIQNTVNAWKHMLFTVEGLGTYYAPTIDELCLYNRICMSNLYPGAGQIKTEALKRLKGVKADGSNNNCNEIFRVIPYDNDYSIEERACRLYCGIVKKDLFNSGNECAARIITNQYLIHKGIGYFTITEEFASDVREQIAAMRYTVPSKKFTNYLVKHAIKGGL